MWREARRLLLALCAGAFSLARRKPRGHALRAAGAPSETSSPGDEVRAVACAFAAEALVLPFGASIATVVDAVESARAHRHEPRHRFSALALERRERSTFRHGLRRAGSRR